MDKIGNIIGKRLNQHKIGDAARASEVIHMANQYLSRELKCESNDARAFQIKGGILWIKVNGSSWNQEVWSRSFPLLKKIQKEYGENFVKKIRTKSLTIK